MFHRSKPEAIQTEIVDRITAAGHDPQDYDVAVLAESVIDRARTGWWYPVVGPADFWRLAEATRRDRMQ